MLYAIFVSWIFVIYLFVIQIFNVPAGSMYPTLAVGDRFVLNKLAYGLVKPFSKGHFLRWGSVQRGDIVVFKYPEDDRVYFVKRVVAIAGDRVRVAENGHVFVNNEEIENPKPLSEDDCAPFTLQMPKLLEDENKYACFQNILGENEYVTLFRTNTFGHISMDETLIPESHFFVMGDNRDNSNDSRFWGFVPETHLVGRLFTKLSN